MTSPQYKYTQAELIESVGRISYRKYSGITRNGDKFYYEGRQIIPVEQHSDFLQKFYDNPETGYCGITRLYAKIADDYAGISRRDVATFLRNLETAQIHQIPKRVPISRPVVLRKPLTTFAIDLTWLKEIDNQSLTTVEKDSQIVMTVIDMFSKYAWAVVLRNKTAKTVATALKGIFDASGAPKTMRSDNGKEFVAEEFQKLLREYNVKHILSDTYSPQQNAMIERFNRTLKTAVYKFQSQWNIKKINNADLQKLVRNYNNTMHTTTNQVPSEVQAGDDTAVYIARKEIKARARELLAKNDHNFEPLKTGDTVRVARRTAGEWRKSRQLKQYSYMANWFRELFTINEITRKSATKASMYKLKDENGDVIERWFLRQDLMKVKPRKLKRELETTDDYVVERVVDSRMRNGHKEYRVRWYGYEESDDTWEAPQPSFQKLIDEYERGAR